MASLSALLTAIIIPCLLAGVPGIILACTLFALAIYLYPFSSHIKKMIQQPIGPWPYLLAGLVPAYTAGLALLGDGFLRKFGIHDHFVTALLIGYYISYKFGRSVFKGMVINKCGYSEEKYYEKESPEEGNGYLWATLIVIACVASAFLIPAFVRAIS